MAAKDDVEAAMKRVLAANLFTEDSLAIKQTIIRDMKVELDKLVKSGSINGYLVGFTDNLIVSYQKDLEVTTIQAKYNFEFIES